MTFMRFEVSKEHKEKSFAFRYLLIMTNIIPINSVKEYNKAMGQETLHPLVSVIDFSKCEPFEFHRMQLNIYAIFLKDLNCGDMIYGLNKYDYEEGSLIFISPGQVYGIDSKGEKRKGVGTAIIFHPDLILGT
ncbi:MAG: hypothetical protein ACK5LR_05835, partial [Mangrovibacterium sp.]